MLKVNQDKIKTTFSLSVLLFVGLVILCTFFLQGWVDTVEQRIFRFWKYERYAAETKERGGFSTAESPPVLSKAGPAASIPVLLYHGIVKKNDRFNLTPETMFDQLYTLKRAGYETVSLNDFSEFLDGKKELPAKSFVLTFDDGRKDSYYGADPILRALDYEAVMFIATGQSLTPQAAESPYYLSTYEVREMQKTGRWEIQSHAVQSMGGEIPLDAEGTQGNFLSNKLFLADEHRLETDEEYGARVEGELSDSKKAIEKTLSSSVSAFAYPFGDDGAQSRNNLEKAPGVIQAAVEKNYRMAFKQVWPNDGVFLFNQVDAPRTILKRIESPTDWTGDELLASLEHGQAKDLPFFDAFERDLGWLSVWDNPSWENGAFSISAPKGRTGADTMLEGSERWTDYVYNLKYDWITGSRLSLMARYQDAGDYIACVFGGDRVKIDRATGGATEHLGASVFHVNMISEDGQVGMRVQGDTADCLVNGDVVASAKVPIVAGGIGVKIWDAVKEHAELHLKEISVEAAK
jgi:peptidoglycan/xylan/chitin deacetylase (PgdA/CDA1 family)